MKGTQRPNLKSFLLVALLVVTTGLLLFIGSFLLSPLFPPDDVIVSEPEEQEPEPISQPVAPSFLLSKQSIFAGDYTVLLIKNCQQTDEVLITSPLLPSAPLVSSQTNEKYVLLPVNYRTASGDYPLSVQVWREGQLLLDESPVLSILPKEFAKQYLTVSEKLEETRSADRLQKDTALVHKAKAVSEAFPLWEGLFVLPVEGRISTEYGLVRYINKKETGRHSGLDIAAPRGTPVRAANNGVIKLSQKLLVTGNSIIIDHGLNLFTSYAHLDRLLVIEGQQVTKGDIIGEVGSTGFSTGPHLHWTASIGLTFTNPWALLREDLLQGL